MNTVQLGNTDVHVSTLCMGTDMIGSKHDQDTSFTLFDYFFERGGTFIDTANFYSSWFPGCVGGESETTIGNWMKARGNREKIQISSKLAFDYPGSDGGLSASEIERECEKSLKRLQTDYLDVYYAHRDDFETPLEETMTAFDRLIKAGKVRAIGASNLWLWRIAEANMLSELKGLARYSVVEQRYTYLRPRHGADFGPQICIDDDLKRYAENHGITLIGYSILLAGAYTRDDKELPMQFAGPDADERLAVLSAVAQEVGATMNQVIVAWMLHSKPFILPIIAGSKTSQLEENIVALDLKLSAEQMERLNNAGNPDIKRAWLQPS